MYAESYIAVYYTKFMICIKIMIDIMEITCMAKCSTFGLNLLAAAVVPWGKHFILSCLVSRKGLKAGGPLVASNMSSSRAFLVHQVKIQLAYQYIRKHNHLNNNFNIWNFVDQDGFAEPIHFLTPQISTWASWLVTRSVIPCSLISSTRSLMSTTTASKQQV